jgi:hypothetical protein
MRRSTARDCALHYKSVERARLLLRALLCGARLCWRPTGPNQPARTPSIWIASLTACGKTRSSSGYSPRSATASERMAAIRRCCRIRRADERLRGGTENRIAMVDIAGGDVPGSRWPWRC